MNETEKQELDALYKEACVAVLKDTLIEKQVLEFGVTKIDLSTPEGLVLLGSAISGEQTK
jgi:hypothetical protein